MQKRYQQWQSMGVKTVIEQVRLERYYEKLIRGAGYLPKNAQEGEKGSKPFTRMCNFQRGRND